MLFRIILTCIKVSVYFSDRLTFEDDYVPDDGILQR